MAIELQTEPAGRTQEGVRNPKGLFHLVSDLDGTWIPELASETGLEELEAFLGQQRGMTLTFATGRTFESASALIEERLSRMPDHLITDVGTVLYHRSAEGQWQEDLVYSAWVDERWDKDLWKILCVKELPEGLRLQPGIFPPRRVALQVENPESLLVAAGKLQAMLYKLGVQADVLTSNQWCIDVLPADVDKGTAVGFLEEHLNTPRPLIACGDSENDLGLWRMADYAVLMADSPLDLGRIPWKGNRVLRASKPGPAGIHEFLRRWECDELGL